MYELIPFPRGYVITESTVNSIDTQVYGESSYDLVGDIISELKLTEDDVFLDLGSGLFPYTLSVKFNLDCPKFD